MRIFIPIFILFFHIIDQFNILNHFYPTEKFAYNQFGYKVFFSYLFVKQIKI